MATTKRGKSDADAADRCCWLDALPLALIDAHIATQSAWMPYHLALAYRRYAVRSDGSAPRFTGAILRACRRDLTTPTSRFTGVVVPAQHARCRNGEWWTLIYNNNIVDVDESLCLDDAVERWLPHAFDGKPSQVERLDWKQTWHHLGVRHCCDRR